MPSSTHSTPVSFADLGLPDYLTEQVERLGFTEPTPIQQQAIPVLLEGRDLVGVAQTGTGKTAAFGLPMLTRLDLSSNHVQALVLAPTRELALQGQRSIESFAPDSARIKTLAVYGGAPYFPQERALRDGVHVVVGTPGRIIDHIERKNLDLSHVSFLVLDEGDEMLRMGFAEEVERIMEAMPEKRQMALFSATMPDAIRKTAARHLHNPAQVSVTPQSTTVAAIDQLFAVIPPRHKIGALARVLATSDAEASLVFVRTRADAEEVCTGLVARGVSASVISGDVSQNEREKVVERIRSGLVRVLVATDVAARGLDIDTIGMVVNYDLPHDNESYVHRIGRTGRAGRSGIALSFVGPKMVGRIGRLEQALHIKMTEFHIPTPAEVSAHRIVALLNGVPARLARGRLDIAVGAVNKFIAANPSITDATEIVAAIAAIAVGDTGVTLEREESFSSSDSSDRPRKRSFEPRGEGGRQGPRKQFHDDGPRRPLRDRDQDRDREGSPRKSYRDRDDAPRTSYRDREDSPRRSYRDRDEAPRSSYRDREDAPRTSYRDRDETPRRPYREEGQDWGARAPRSRQGDDSTRRAPSSDRSSSGEPRHESTKPWARTDHQHKRFTAAPTWKASAKPRKKKH